MAQNVVAEQTSTVAQTVVTEQASTVAQTVLSEQSSVTAQAVGAAPIATATQTVNTAPVAPSGWSVVTESTTQTKEDAMSEQTTTTLDPSIAAEYLAEMSQLTASLNAFKAKLENDKNVSEQALKNFIANPLDGSQGDVSFHAARLSYSKEMLDRLHAVSVTLSL
jgi:hypothetical protein